MNFEVFFSILIIGISTFTMRISFLIHKFSFFERKRIKSGLNGIPSSLLIALVIPFAFFSDGNQILFSREAAAIFFTIPIIWYTKKPGMSLVIALIIYYLIDFIMKIG